MAVKEGIRIAPPMKIMGLLQSKWANEALKTAVELDVFTHLKNSAMSAAELGQTLKLDKRGAAYLLDALAAMEFVTKKDERFELTDVSRHYLCKDSELYFGTYVLFRDVLDAGWAQLTNVVRTGEPVARVNEQEQGEKFFRDLTVGIFPINYTTAQALAADLHVQEKNGDVRVLDLAAGSGVWSLPMAQSNNNVHVDALDFPGVLGVTKDFATKFGVADRYQYLSGDWRNVPLKDEHYDFIILGHILHSEGKEESQKLLQKCSAALKKGGMLIVAEFLENEERSGPLFPALFALNMMIATARGCVFTVKELVAMMESAGLHDAKRLKLPVWEEQSPVMVATR